MSENRTLTLSKHEMVVDRHHDITVVIEGGMCVDVVGLPEEWGYIIQDNDGALVDIKSLADFIRRNKDENGRH